EFFQLFDSLEAYGKPQTTADYMAVYQATVLTWDILRYQDMKVGVLRSHLRGARRSTSATIAVCGSEANFRRTMSLLFSRSVASRSIIRPRRCSKVSAVTSG